MHRQYLSLSSLPGPMTEALEYWRSLGGETLNCSWENFELHRLPAEILPTVMVTDLFDDEAKNMYRYWGRGMTEVHGRDMTGKSPYDLSPPEFAESLREQHRVLREQRKPDAQVFNFTRARGIDHAHMVLRLPLSDDGQSVDHIVVIVWLSEESWKIVGREGPGVLPRIWADVAD